MVPQVDLMKADASASGEPSQVFYGATTVRQVLEHGIRERYIDRISRAVPFLESCLPELEPRQLMRTLGDNTFDPRQVTMHLRFQF